MGTPKTSSPGRAPLAERWTPEERGALSRYLERLFGVTIRELSDVRERCGLPRLSESTRTQRDYARLILMGERGQSALRAIREERARTELALLSIRQSSLKQARAKLGLKKPRIQWRIGELHKVFAEAMALEIEQDDREASEARRVRYAFVRTQVRTQMESMHHG